MSKTIKIIAGLLGLVVVVIVAAAVILPLVVDPNDYREQIAARVEEATGRPMEIEGDLSLSVFPWLGVEIGRTRLGNPAGFGDRPFLQVESVSVGARLWPLLSRRLEVSKLRLEGLELDLVKSRDGRGNWEGLGGEPAPDEEPASGEGPAMQIAGIAGLEILDARVRYEDVAAGKVTEVKVPRLATGELAPGRPFTVDGQAEITTGEPAATLGMSFEARVKPNDDFSAVTVEALDLRATGRSDDPVMAFKAEATVPAIEFDVTHQKGSASGLAVSVSGEMAGDPQQASVSASSASFDLAGPSITLSGLEATATLQQEGRAHEARLTAPEASVDLGRQVLTLAAFAAEADGVSVTGNVAGDRIVDAPKFSGAVKVAEFSPRALMERLGIEPPPTADAAVLSAASVESRFAATPDQVTLEGLSLRLDDTRATGRASLGTGQTTRVTGALEVDAIDLDRYLPPESEGESGEDEAADEELAFDWLEGLVMDASLAVGRLKVSGLTLTDVRAKAVARDGILSIEPATAALYGGTARGTVRLDASQSPAVFSVRQSLGGLGLGPFLSDLAGFERMAGAATLEADVETRARTTSDLLRGLNGSVAFDITDAVFKGVNLWYEVQRAYALYERRTPPAKPSPDTAFREMKGTALIKDGVITNDNFTAGLETLGLTGKGRVDLAKAALDYSMEATVWKQVTDEATGQVSELAGARLPLKISGELGSPSVNVDLAGMVKSRAEKKIMEKLGVEGVEGEQGQSSEEALKEKAKDKLKKLFGGDG